MDTDSRQVPWGKDEKNFEKRVKEYVKLLRGKWYGEERGSCDVNFLKKSVCRIHSVCMCEDS